MIMYRRSEWYGLMYLTTFRGSVMPKLLPPALFAALISVLIHLDKDYGLLGENGLEWAPRDDENYPLLEWLTQSYGMQLFGSGVGAGVGARTMLHTRDAAGSSAARRRSPRIDCRL